MSGNSEEKRYFPSAKTSQVKVSENEQMQVND